MNHVIDELETLLESCELEGDEESAQQYRRAIEILKEAIC
jgi:hypothetical protein